MRMTSRAPRLSSLAVAALVTAGTFSACSSHRAVQVHDIKPGDDLFGTLTKLKAGDEVVIHAGTYTTPGFYEVRWPGTAAAPITIHGAPGEARPVIVGSTLLMPGCEVLSRRYSPGLRDLAGRGLLTRLRE